MKSPYPRRYTPSRCTPNLSFSFKEKMSSRINYKVTEKIDLIFVQNFVQNFVLNFVLNSASPRLRVKPPPFRSEAEPR